MTTTLSPRESLALILLHLEHNVGMTTAACKAYDLAALRSFLRIDRTATLIAMTTGFARRPLVIAMLRETIKALDESDQDACPPLSDAGQATLARSEGEQASGNVVSLEPGEPDDSTH